MSQQQPKSVAVDKGREANALFALPTPLVDGVFVAGDPDASEDEEHTSGAFSEKWTTLGQEAADEEEGWKRVQLRWYLTCYGYDAEQDFAAFLKTRRMILDAGCGPGYKAAWFARLNPHALVVAMDLSDSIFVAARRYESIPNMVFVKGDISDTPFRDGSFDFISCDQVLHHTDNPLATVREFHRLLKPSGQLNTYVYARKAVPRELLDDWLLEQSKRLSREEIWELSDQVTQLGKALAELDIQIDIPAMPALGIKGGRQDLQRFIYWNFIKCFWNSEYGFEGSKITNFDWYAPSTAFRYSREEFVALLSGGGFTPQFLHSEEPCHTGRFTK